MTIYDFLFLLSKKSDTLLTIASYKNDTTYTTLATLLPADYYDVEIEGIETEFDGGIIIYVEEALK